MHNQRETIIATQFYIELINFLKFIIGIHNSFHFELDESRFAYVKLHLILYFIEYNIDYFTSLTFSNHALPSIFSIFNNKSINTFSLNLKWNQNSVTVKMCRSKSSSWSLNIEHPVKWISEAILNLWFCRMLIIMITFYFFFFGFENLSCSHPFSHRKCKMRNGSSTSIVT